VAKDNEERNQLPTGSNGKGEGRKSPNDRTEKKNQGSDLENGMNKGGIDKRPDAFATKAEICIRKKLFQTGTIV